MPDAICLCSIILAHGMYVNNFNYRNELITEKNSLNVYMNDKQALKV